jgi:hypothetical protein
MPDHSLLKFRPVLTLEQIRHIVHLTKEDDIATDFGELEPTGTHQKHQNVSIRRVLIPLLAKVEVGAINPAYKLSETHALKQETAKQRQRYENDEMSAEEAAKYESEVLGL